jgi:predicted nucleotidyltransferase
MDSLAGELEGIAARYGLRDVYAFGSRASEALARVSARLPPEHPASHSDLDLAVQPVAGRTLSPRERVRLAIELEDLFGVPRVDLVVLSEASPFLAAEVVSGELLHTSDALGQAEHELYVLRRAADLAPFRRERTRMILEEDAR